MTITVPVSWLREYLKTDIATKTLANYLSLAGPSVEKITPHKNDHILEIEVTSNRPDSFSVFGLAREANAILAFENQKTSLISPQGLNTSLDPDSKNLLTLDVVIKEKGLCPRFMAIVLDNIKIKPSPALVKSRLQASGIRPINNIVDISNYLMLELGQPMHTFDFDKIKGSKMVLRQSLEGEKIKTLDGKIRILPKGTIVIEDSQKLIDLCGIMGGENSQISKRTKRVVLFVQAYDPAKIRKTTQTLAFRTDASTRFEKGVDLEGIPQALSRAVYLAKKSAGAKIASELIDIYPNKQKAKTINLYYQRLSNYLGINLQFSIAAHILTLLGFSVKTSAQILTATAPSWRSQDMDTQEDLIEEIARIYGYHRLPSKFPTGEIRKEAESDLSKVISLKSALKFLGLTEVVSYSTVSKEFLLLAQVSEKDAVELANPLSQEWQFMRPTILVSLASVISQNQNLRSNLKLFEVAKTYVKQSNNQTIEQFQLPIQDLHLAIGLQNSSFSEIKGYIENIFEILGRDALFKKPTKEVALFERSLCAKVILNGKTVSTLGILKRSITNHFALDSDIAVAELNLSIIYHEPPVSKGYKPIPKYPPRVEDISAIFAKNVPVADIVKTIKKAGENLIHQVEITDIYEDEKIGDDKKSVTLRLYYQKPDGTPTQEEVEKTRDNIQIELIKNLKAHIRG